MISEVGGIWELTFGEENPVGEGVVGELLGVLLGDPDHGAPLNERSGDAGFRPSITRSGPGILDILNKGGKVQKNKQQAHLFDQKRPLINIGMIGSFFLFLDLSYLILLSIQYRSA